jgi:shikimate kinase
MPTRPGHILLIGLRGSGKSTLGALLARAADKGFIDLDAVTPAILGRASVADAFARDGETAFREAEARAIEDSLARPACVIALGGGAPTAPGAADMISRARGDDRAIVIYLRAQPDALRRRLQEIDNADRPSLTGAGMLEEIDAVFARRDPLYRSLADAIISTDDLTIDETLALLVAAVERQKR